MNLKERKKAIISQIINRDKSIEHDYKYHQYETEYDESGYSIVFKEREYDEYLNNDVCLTYKLEASADRIIYTEKDREFGNNVFYEENIIYGQIKKIQVISLTECEGLYYVEYELSEKEKFLIAEKIESLITWCE